ncbi:MAG: mechanosensitive ion channel [Eubacteriales bacterium]|nr:mechanosensitive ion channel [Eubacteriales bacterium]
MNKRLLPKLIVFLIITAILAAAAAATGALKELPAALSYSLSAGSLLNILLMIFGTLFISTLISFVLGMFHPENHRAKTVLTISTNLIRYIAIVVIFCGILAILNVDVITIIAGLGIIALIIGFAAESLISDVVTGMFILVDNQYNVGDIIEVNDFRGTVTEIGIRTTCVTDTGGNVRIINNSDMKNILNRSENSSKAVVDFPIPYDTDLTVLEEKIPALLDGIYQAHGDMLKSAPVYLGVQQLGESSVDLRFVAEVGEKDIYSGARLLNHDLFIGFRKLGVECPFQQVDIHTN